MLLASCILILKQVYDYGQTDAVLFDFLKAFDKLSHTWLLLKLNHYGIRNSTVKWIEKFLTGCKH